MTELSSVDAKSLNSSDESIDAIFKKYSPKNKETETRNNRKHFKTKFKSLFRTKEKDLPTYVSYENDIYDLIDEITFETCKVPIIMADKMVQTEKEEKRQHYDTKNQASIRNKSIFIERFQHLEIGDGQKVNTKSDGLHDVPIVKVKGADGGSEARYEQAETTIPSSSHGMFVSLRGRLSRSFSGLLKKEPSSTGDASSLIKEKSREELHEGTPMTPRTMMSLSESYGNEQNQSSVAHKHSEQSFESSLNL